MYMAPSKPRDQSVLHLTCLLTKQSLLSCLTVFYHGPAGGTEQLPENLKWARSESVLLLALVFATMKHARADAVWADTACGCTILERNTADGPRPYLCASLCNNKPASCMCPSLEVLSTATFFFFRVSVSWLDQWMDIPPLVKLWAVFTSLLPTTGH